MYNARLDELGRVWVPSDTQILIFGRDGALQSQIALEDWVAELVELPLPRPIRLLRRSAVQVYIALYRLRHKPS